MSANTSTEEAMDIEVLNESNDSMTVFYPEEEEWTSELCAITENKTIVSKDERRDDFHKRFIEKFHEIINGFAKSRGHWIVDTEDIPNMYRCYKCKHFAKAMVSCRPIEVTGSVELHTYFLHCVVDIGKDVKINPCLRYCVGDGHEFKANTIGPEIGDFMVLAKENYEFIVNTRIDCDRCDRAFPVDQYCGHNCATTLDSETEESERQSAASNVTEELRELHRKVADLEEALKNKGIDYELLKSRYEKTTRDLDNSQKTARVLRDKFAESENKLRTKNNEIKDLVQKNKTQEEVMNWREEDFKLQLNGATKVAENARRRERLPIDRSDYRIYANCKAVTKEKYSQNSYEVYNELFPGGKRVVTTFTDKAFLEKIGNLLTYKNGPLDGANLKDWVLLNVEYEVIEFTNATKMMQLADISKAPNWAWTLMPKKQIPNPSLNRRIELRFASHTETPQIILIREPLEKTLKSAVTEMYGNFLAYSSDSQKQILAESKAFIDPDLAESFRKTQELFKTMNEKQESVGQNSMTEPQMVNVTLKAQKSNKETPEKEATTEDNSLVKLNQPMPGLNVANLVNEARLQSSLKTRITGPTVNTYYALGRPKHCITTEKIGPEVATPQKTIPKKTPAIRAKVFGRNANNGNNKRQSDSSSDEDAKRKRGSEGKDRRGNHGKDDATDSGFGDKTA